MIDLNDVLLAMSNIPVDDPIAEIWGRGLQSGYKIIEYTGTLPITITANGDALLDYRIYGTDDGVGEPTDSGEPAGYKLPMTVIDNLAPPLSQWVNGYITTYGSLAPSSVPVQKEKTSDFIEIKPNTQYTFGIEGNAFPQGNNGSWLGIGLYCGDRTFISRPSSYLDPSPYTFLTPSEAKYVRLSYRTYGELLEPRLSENSFSIPIYIGENQLDAGEYVDYGEQKIYRDVSGTLTPTDPPVPLPQIPTIDGTTVIDYDGDPKPSQMYVKYNDKG
mgnify:CR=1 FL=1